VEDVWCGELSSTAVIGTVSLERWKYGINVKLSKQKAFEIRAEGTCVGSSEWEGTLYKCI